MQASGTTARQGLIFGLAGVEASVRLAAYAARHTSWLLDWHTRTHPGGGCHGGEAGGPISATLRMMRAA